ncbi:MAG: helix-turn-helix transcriptional regulator [Acidobacteria bacterium]|nr:helix-turn-helix transcriptional regulator [Acidobacteriota bacterium]
MPLDFTKTLESSRLLLKAWRQRGKDDFARMLDEMARCIVSASGENAREVNGRFMIIVKGILSVLFVNRAEFIIRQSVLVSENFLNEPDLGKKREALVSDLTAFLQDLDAERSDHAFSEGVVLYLKTCPVEELRNASVESMADRFGLSRNYFADKFKKEKDMTVHDAVIEEKLNRALLALKSENEEESVPVKQLSWMLGFSDPVYFSRLFRKRFGFNPTEIRDL